MSDIYEMGFNKSLNREITDNSTGVVYDAVSDAVNTGQMLSGGNLTLKTLTIGGFVKQMSPGDDLQEMIDSVARDGGGTVELKAGTYLIRKNIEGKSNVRLRGAKEGSTILSFDGPFNLSYTGSQVYTTGTITSIASGVLVTGSGTAWLTNASIDHQFFIGDRWYKIAAVTGDTTITLAEGYTGGATFPGAAYRIAKPIKDIDFEELSFKDSDGTALVLTDVRNVTTTNCTFEDNNKGFVYNNVSELNFDNVLCVSNDNNGYEFNSCGFADIEALAAISNGNHGGVLNDVRVFPIQFSATNANTADGLNVISATDTIIEIESSSNGGQGIELVSGCDNVIMRNCLVNANTSDGIKLTATSDNCKITDSNIKSNGGYGLNIAAASCDNNIVTGNTFVSNSSGSANDSGTGTVVRGNVGLGDNATSSNDYQTFTSSNTWTKPSNAGANSIVIVELWGGGGGGGSGSAGQAGGGGGGGSYVRKEFRASDLTSTVSVTIAGTAAAQAAGASSTFGAYSTAYGGGGGVSGTGGTNNGAGGGGGGMMSVGGNGTAGSGGAGGDPVGGAGGTTGGAGQLGGGGATSNGGGGISAYGGGGGSGSGNSAGGASLYGGGGGGSVNVTTGVTAGGASTYAGAGGAGVNGNGVAGSAPAGGGGGGGGSVGGTGGLGGRGECRVWTLI